MLVSSLRSGQRHMLWRVTHMTDMEKVIYSTWRNHVKVQPPKELKMHHSNILLNYVVQSCIKVDLGFVSPDNIEECIRLTDELMSSAYFSKRNDPRKINW
nr:lysine-specific demethylase JMJ25-like [Tanacetum cinerariifolium]